MAPRNNDTSTSYSKKKSFSVDNDGETDVACAVPCLLHKKHKVVKLVKSQLEKIMEEGIRCDVGICRAADTSDKSSTKGRRLLTTDQSGVPEDRSRFDKKYSYLSFCLLPLALLLLLLLFLMVWISAGPLSNSMAHTPIAAMSFLRIDGFCSLEKKYLLRWSKPEY